MSEAIMVRGLTKTYGDRVVVNNLDLSVKSGTVFGLLGANGAGKSTTIECILGTKQVGGVAKDTRQSGVIASILYFPMLVFSGTTLPIEVMPQAMQRVVSLFPLTQGITLMKATFLGLAAGSVLLPVVVMLAVTALCTIFAIRFFRWE